MSNTEYANAVLSHVVQGFRLQPPKEPDRLVNVLDQVLRLKSKEERARLNNFKWVLFDLAENQLADDFLADETGETRKAFEAYFNQVFETYVDPEREVMLL